MATLSTISIKLDADTMGFGRKLDSARNNVMDFGQKIQPASGGLASLATNFGLAGGAAGLAFVAVNKVTDAITNLASAAARSTVSFARWGIQLAGDAQQVEAQMTVLVGSTTRAQALIGDLRDYAARTPFEMQGLSQNAQMLLGFGMSVDKVMPSLEMLGDVAGGNADRMNRLTLAFAQSSSAGRLMGQDLLQMINAQFNPLEELEKLTGKNSTELRKMMEQGQISFAMVEEAFQSATTEGGRFAGMMDDLNGTFNIQFDMMQESVRELARTFGETLLPSGTMAVGEITAAVRGLTEEVEASGPILAAAFESITENLIYSSKVALQFTLAILEAWSAPLKLAGFDLGIGGAMEEIEATIERTKELNKAVKAMQKDMDAKGLRFPKPEEPYHFPAPEALPGTDKDKSRGRMFGDLYKAADRFGRHLGRGIDGGLKNIVKFLEQKDVKQILDPPSAHERGSVGAQQAILAAQRVTMEKPEMKNDQTKISLLRQVVRLLEKSKPLSPANIAGE